MAIEADVVSTRSWMRARHCAVAAALALTLISTELVATTPAGAVTLAVNGIVASTSTLPPQGGPVSLSATPTQNATCSVIVTPPGPVIPPTVSCAAGVKITFRLDVPGNTTARTDPYKNFIMACSHGTCVKSAAVKVTQRV